jgi:hypothetical protein
MSYSVIKKIHLGHLQEGAILKKRFDDNFDSTKYEKALEVIKDNIKKKRYI